jgi:hypothetical protein
MVDSCSFLICEEKSTANRYVIVGSMSNFMEPADVYPAIVLSTPAVFTLASVKAVPVHVVIISILSLAVLR